MQSYSMSHTTEVADECDITKGALYYLIELNQYS